MASYRTSRIVSIVLILVVIVLAIAALVAAARVMFVDGANSTQTSGVTTARDNLLNTSVNRSVSFTARGPIVADEDFRSYSITISPSSRTISTYQGYSNKLIKSASYANTPVAYEQFVYALDNAGILKSKTLDPEKNDVRGVCAIGRVYSFDILDQDKKLASTWASSCIRESGTLQSGTTKLEHLFVSQIPESDTVLSEISL